MLAIYHDAMIRSGKVIHEAKWVSDSHILAHSYAVRPMTRTSFEFLNNDNYFKSLNDFFIKNMLIKSSNIIEVIGMNDKPEDKKKTRDSR